MKKLVLILLILAAVGGGTAFALRFARKETLKSNMRAPEGNAEVTALLTKDTDSDGLKDWEEELWGTDKANFDTDGDGTGDSEEIRNRRNPVVKGPNDPLDEASIETKTTLNKNSGPETETDRLAREFFNTYVELKKEGVELTPENIEAISQKLFESAPELTSKTYTQSDIVISPDTSTEAIRTYGNTIGLIIGSAAATQENEIEVLDRAARDQDPGAVASFDPIIAGYAKLLAELQAVPVPHGAEKGHLMMLESLDGIKTSIVKMRELFKNPVVVLPALKLHKESADKLIGAFRALDEYFIVHDVSFKESEGGYLIIRLSV